MHASFRRHSHGGTGFASFHSPGLAVEHSQFTPPSNEAPFGGILSAGERAALDRLGRTWGMDADEKAFMLRQCERGGELADGLWLAPDAAQRFWFSEA